MLTFLLRLFVSTLIFSVSFCQAENRPLKTRSLLSGKIPVIQIHAEKLSPLDIGLEIGRQSKLMFTDIEQRYDAYLSASLNQMRFDDMLKSRLPELIRNVEHVYQKELEGVASSWSLIHNNKLGDGFLSWDEYWLLNLLPDIGLPANGTGFGVLNQVSKENSTMIGRNLDLISTPELRSLQAITVYNYADRIVVNIGFAGIISVVTGFNDSGLFVAHFNAAPESSYQNPFQAKQYVKGELKTHVFTLRKALDSLKSAQQAINYLFKNSYAVSSNTLVADKKNIKIIEYPRFGKASVRSWSSKVRPNKHWNSRAQIVVVDCHVLFDIANNCRRAKDNYRWDRLRTMANFTSSNKADTQDISKIMLDNKNQYYEILGSNTIQSMIYLPVSSHLYLYAAPSNTAKIPPAYQVYYRDIFPLGVHQAKTKGYFFWWIISFLVLLAFILWAVRRSIKTKEKNSET